MDKMYHIYDVKSKCEYAVLSEEDFQLLWKDLDHTRYEYEELTIDHAVVSDSSY